ncbi:MAG: MFS transporter, partial [Chloroflexota bacterium]
MRLLKHSSFLAVSLSHFIVDVFNGQIGILLAVLSVPLALANSTIGLIATIYAISGAVSQPVFGWLSDRFGGRWTTAGGVIWMAACFSLAAVTPGTWPLLFLVVGSLGSAAFHPPGAMKASQMGNLHMAGQAATAASIFFLFGQSGLSLGPAAGGAIIDHLGLRGLLLVTALGLPIGLFAAWALRGETAHQPGTRAAPRTGKDEIESQTQWVLFSLVLLVAGLKSWSQMAITTFAPKYFHDLGLAPTIYGAIVAVFMGGSAIGGVVGGMASDRWGQRRTITLALALSIAPLYFFPIARGLWVYPVALIAGFFNGAPHSVLVTMAQKLIPGKAATASGIILGFMFTSGAVGVYFSGLAADHIGLMRVL